MATPMPLSAPRVVPSAVTQSPSTLSLMGSFSKSCLVAAFFSQTMSTWPWISTGAAFSQPWLPGIEISRLPTLSSFQARPRSSAQALNMAWTAASLPEPRGTSLICSKICQTAAGWSLSSFPMITPVLEVQLP